MKQFSENDPTIEHLLKEKILSELRRFNHELTLIVKYRRASFVIVNFLLFWLMLREEKIL